MSLKGRKLPLQDGKDQFLSDAQPRDGKLTAVGGGLVREADAIGRQGCSQVAVTQPHPQASAI